MRQYCHHTSSLHDVKPQATTRMMIAAQQGYLETGRRGYPNSQA